MPLDFPYRQIRHQLGEPIRSQEFQFREIAENFKSHSFIFQFKMSRQRNWVFTVNNYCDDEVEAIKALKCKYLVFGFEVGEQGTPHLQGLICFQSGMTRKSLSKKIPRARLDVMRGTFEQASKYCKKDGVFFESGELPKDPKKKGEVEQSRWKRARELALEGEFDDIDDQIFLRCYGTLKKIRSDKLMMEKKPDSTAEHLWFWGKAGTGKSRRARELYPDAYLKMCNKWWNGYVPGSRSPVIIEDFDRKHDCLIHHLKIWADRYDFPCEMKGSAARIRPEIIVVTSNYHPSQIWTEESDLEPILRRFKCVQFGENLIPAAVSTFTPGQQ